MVGRTWWCAFRPDLTVMTQTVSFGLGAAQHPPRPECLYTRHALSCISEGVVVVVNSWPSGDVYWSMQNPGCLVMYHFRSMHQHQANIQTNAIKFAS